MKAVSATRPVSSMTSPAKRGCLGIKILIRAERSKPSGRRSRSTCLKKALRLQTSRRTLRSPLRAKVINLLLAAFDGCKQNACSNAQAAVEHFIDIHAEINIELIGKWIERLFQVSHAICAEGDVIVLGNQVGEKTTDKCEAHAVFKQFANHIVAHVQNFPFIAQNGSETLAAKCSHLLSAFTIHHIIGSGEIHDLAGLDHQYFLGFAFIGIDTNVLADLEHLLFAEQHKSSAGLIHAELAGQCKYLAFE